MVLSASLIARSNLGLGRKLWAYERYSKAVVSDGLCLRAASYMAMAPSYCSFSDSSKPWSRKTSPWLGPVEVAAEGVGDGLKGVSNGLQSNNFTIAF